MSSMRISTAYATEPKPAASMASRPLVIDGYWTELRIISRQAKEFVLPLGTTPITLTCQ